MSIFSKLKSYKREYPEDEKPKKSVGRRISDSVINLAYEQGRFKNCPRDKGKTQVVKMDW